MTLTDLGLPLRLAPKTSPAPDPTWDRAEITARREIGRRYVRLALRAPTIAHSAQAGQFVMVTIGGGESIVLPRPMAIHRRRPERGEIEIVLVITGRGTEELARLRVGDAVDLIGPLGAGFALPEDGSVLLIGRGIGVGAVMTLAEDAVQHGVPVTALLSAESRDAVIGVDDCEELGVRPIAVSDERGDSGVEAVRQALLAALDARPPGAVMVCGSTRLMRLAAELAVRWNARLQVSIEAHMACGLGYCHGCAAPIPTRPDREGPLVCVDGPVFDVELG